MENQVVVELRQENKRLKEQLAGLRKVLMLTEQVVDRQADLVKTLKARLDLLGE